MKSPNRLPAETVMITVGQDPNDEQSRGHKLKVSLAYDPDTQALREVIFVERTKTGTGLHELLAELGIKLSRAIQGRDPEDGSERFV